MYLIDWVDLILWNVHTVNVRKEEQKPQTSVKDGLSCSSLLSDIRQAIGAEKTRQMFVALQEYKTTNNYEQMVSTVVSLLTERDEDITLLTRKSISVWFITIFMNIHE